MRHFDLKVDQDSTGVHRTLLELTKGSRLATVVQSGMVRSQGRLVQSDERPREWETISTDPETDQIRFHVDRITEMYWDDDFAPYTTVIVITPPPTD